MEKEIIDILNRHLATQEFPNPFTGEPMKYALPCVTETSFKKVAKEIAALIQKPEPVSNPVAYEFHNLKTGHCYVDYIRRTDIEQVGDGEYVQKPLFYGKPK